MSVHQALLRRREWLAKQLVLDLLLWQTENGLNKAFNACLVGLAGVWSDHVFHSSKEVKASFDLALLSENLHAVRNEALDPAFLVGVLHGLSAVCDEERGAELLLGNELLEQH